MYKILTKGIATNGVVNWSFYKEFGQEYATKNFEIAITKYRDLMASYSLNNLKLVDDINLNVEIIVEPIPNTIIPVTVETTINDGTTVEIKISTVETNYVWVDYNEDIFNEVEQYLLGLGLTDVEIIPWHTTITAQNPTGEPVIGAFAVKEGLLTAYDSESKTTNNISSEFEFEIV